MKRGLGACLVVVGALAVGCDDGTSEQPTAWNFAEFSGPDTRIFYVTNDFYPARLEAGRRGDTVSLTLLEDAPAVRTLVAKATCVTVRLPHGMRGRRLVSGVRPDSSALDPLLRRYEREKPRCRRAEASD